MAPIGLEVSSLLQKHRNVFVLSSIHVEHRPKPFKLTAKNSIRGRCFRRPRVSRRGLTHLLNMETLDVGYDTEQPGKGKGTACKLPRPNLKPLDAFGALLAKILRAETPRQKGYRKMVAAHKGCAVRVQKWGSGAERGVPKGRTLGADRVQKGCYNPPSSQGGVAWANMQQGR